MWDGNVSRDGGGGGGFMDETYNQTQGGQQGGEEKKKHSNHVVPMTINQLFQKTPDTIVIAEKPVRLISVVAVVRKIDRVTTKIAYDLEDETGTIQALRWLDGENPEAENDIEVNKYVRVCGSLREQAEKGRHIFLLKIHQLNKLSEIYAHLLDVTFLSIYSEGPDAAKRALGNGTANSNNVTMGNLNTSNSNTADNDAVVDSGLTKDQAMVLRIIQSAIDEQGIERDQIKRQLPPQIVTSADNILDFLASEGHVYTTCTDDYFKAT